MNITWFDSIAELDRAAAEYVARLLAAKPNAAIALPTGNTPLGLYRRLSERQRSGTLTLEQARFFNLDEFCGKGRGDAGSYGAFLWQHAFGPLGVTEDRVRLLRGDASDPETECAEFEAAIASAGGLDLAILGLGRNGHVAFNEPGCDWSASTRRVALTDTTRSAQAGLYADPADVPTHGLTMGIPTILNAKSLLLLVSGSGKETALEAFLDGQPNPLRSVTALVDHPDLTVMADRALHSCREEVRACDNYTS